MAQQQTAQPKPAEGKGKTLLDALATAKANVITRLPRGIDKERFFLGIISAVNRSKANAAPGKSLADCDPASVILAAYDAAECGCNLSPALQLGWLIPYGRECNFQPSYRFFIQKAYDTGEVKAFYAEVVYAGDMFERQYAPIRNLNHAPGDDPAKRTRDNAVGAYALIQFSDGSVDYEFLTREQINRHREKSKQPNSMKWNEFWEEGWRITPIRVLAKRLPMHGRKLEEVVDLIAKDTDRDIDLSIQADDTPSLPRRRSEALQLAPEPEPEPRQAATEEAKADTKTDAKTDAPAQEQAQQSKEGPKEEPKKKNGDAQPGMFAEGESKEDPFVTEQQIKKFWDTLFSVGWKKQEAVDYLKKHYDILSPKDLHNSQIAGVVQKMLDEKK